MANYRYGKAIEELKKSQIKNLTNGPGKLCQAMDISRSENGLDLVNSKHMFLLEDDPPDKKDIITSTRINIGYAEEAIHFPYRFYINSSPYVSVKVNTSK
jgi:DNA-3-methyladenine glycosylase